MCWSRTSGPGTLERWGLAPDVLLADNPRLVIARVTGFGQDGPYAGRPGFGSLAEAMSGFAAMTGEPDGPPTLPPFGLADGIAALATAYAVLAALRRRDATGEGQVVDLAIIEPIMAMLGAPLTAYDQLGYVQPRTGNRSVNNAPRNVYRTADGAGWRCPRARRASPSGCCGWSGGPTWSTSRGSRPAAGGPSTPTSSTRRSAAGSRRGTTDEVVARVRGGAGGGRAGLRRAGRARATRSTRARHRPRPSDDPDLGPLRMQNVLFRLSATPGEVRWAGRGHGADTDEVLGELGLFADEIARLRADGVRVIRRSLRARSTCPGRGRTASTRRWRPAPTR